MQNAQRNFGFTLIELSIVLVVIGLIVGGVLVGKHLIEAAKLRETYSGFTKVETAINTFRLKYNTLPGDTDKAYGTFFGGQSYCTSALRCNGNNNKQVSHKEGRKLLLHLSLAGLIPNGKYDPNESGGEYVTPHNAKTSFYPTPFDHAGITASYTIWTGFNTTYDTICNADSRRQGSFLGAYGVTGNLTSTTVYTGHSMPGFISRNQARTLDEKFDDGVGREGGAFCLWCNRVHHRL